MLVRVSSAAHAESTFPIASVFHGDAFNLFEQLSPGSVDLVTTSPPCWGHHAGNRRAFGLWG